MFFGRTARRFAEIGQRRIRMPAGDAGGVTKHYFEAADEGFHLRLSAAN